MDFKYQPLENTFSLNNYNDEYPIQENEYELSNLKVYTQKKETNDEYMNSRRRCIRCHGYYTNATNGECKYHSGQYIEPVSAKQGVMVGWNCCGIQDHMQMYLPMPMGKMAIMKEERLKKDCIGCQRADFHEEDKSYTSIMSNFPYNENSKDQNDNNNPSAPSLEEIQNITPKNPEDEKKYHFVKSGDTLAGIALRYSVSISSLKQQNNLYSDSIFHLSKLLLPGNAKVISTTPLTNSGAIIKDFVSRTGVSSEEAKYYLDETNYDLDLALEEYNEERNWENKNKK
eukprot:TRINITY_DN6900_c1_g1_i1.p1 TRINITY_DN6900_c1_g1~~TRINITY_DN6900_c1_g1_i1.p1  ORF type:complete len:286 (+),score=80.91 TRINITY_DN6900_c1_g1_i1:53-910(+)